MNDLVTKGVKYVFFVKIDEIQLSGFIAKAVGTQNARPWFTKEERPSAMTALWHQLKKSCTFEAKSYWE